MHFTAVTNFSGVEAQPSLSPDGRSVAFVSNREGQYDIWVGLVTGGRLVRITNDPNLEATPRWSPDGTTIAYSRLNDSGLFDIWQIPALGGTPRRVITGAIEPGWSADGRSIVYRNLSTSTVWISDATGSNARAVTQPDSVSRAHRSPALSHDGRRVALLQWTAGPYGELAVADLADGRIRTLTHDGALVSSPAWSPGDRFLYFASSRGGAVNIWKIPSAGGNPEQITAGQGDDGDLALSADGSRMVFSTYRQNINIALMDLAAGASDTKPTWLTSDAARGEMAPAFSPDGKRIAYFSNRKGAEREGIWVMNADGSDAVPLVVDDYQNTFPRWYRDGQALIFRSSRALLGASGDLIRRVALSGGPPQVVMTPSASAPRSPMPLWVGGQADVDSRGRVLWRNARRRGEIYDPETKKTQVLESCVGEAFRWSPDDRRIAYLGLPEGAEAGLWIYDFRNPPRRIFQGWLAQFAWIGPEELVYAEGKPDLRALLWRVRSDGSVRQRIPATIPTAGMYWELIPGSGPGNMLDVSAGGRYLALRALEQSGADIGMIEGVR
jgi:TolB protein